MFQQHGNACNNWFAKFINFMSGIGVQPAKVDSDTGIWLYEEGVVLDRVRHLCHSAFGEGMSSKLAWYHEHFAAPMPDPLGSKEWCIAPYLNLAWPASKVAAMARFRTRNHFLGVEVGSWRGAAASAKLCCRCDMQVVDDEDHYFFHCPSLSHIRLKFQALFGKPDIHSLTALFFYSRENADWSQVMKDAIRFLLAAGSMYR